MATEDPAGNGDGTSSSTSMSCLLQKQTKLGIKNSGVAEQVEAYAQQTKADKGEAEGYSDSSEVKKHHRQQRDDEEWNPLSTKTKTTTFDEWADYILDGTTTTTAPKKTLAHRVSEKSSSWFWQFLTWIDFLHWFTPAPDEAATNTSNDSNATVTQAPVTNSLEDAEDASDEAKDSNESTANLTLNDSSVAKNTSLHTPA